MFVKLNYVGLTNIFFEKMGKMPLHSEFYKKMLPLKTFK